MKSEGEKTVRATVARGRSVDVPLAGKREVAGYDKETGKPMHRPVMKQFGPGQDVELPADEVATLRKSGHLVDPDRIAPPIGEGPNFTEQGRTQAA